jgi:hypothetical protein
MVDLTENPLTPFAKIDAKLVRFAVESGLRQTLEARRRAPHGPTVKTDEIQGSISSVTWPSHALDYIDSRSESTQEVERELEQLRNDVASSQGDKQDLERHERRWGEVRDDFIRQEYARALKSVIANQGGPFKSGRMQPYYAAAERGATIAGNRALTLHTLPEQPDVMSGTAPSLKPGKYATKAAGFAGKFMPALGGAAEGAAQAVEFGIDLESARRFNAFHDKLANVGRR